VLEALSTRARLLSESVSRLSFRQPLELPAGFDPADRSSEFPNLTLPPDESEQRQQRTAAEGTDREIRSGAATDRDDRIARVDARSRETGETGETAGSGRTGRIKAADNVDSPAESSRDVRDMCVRYRTLTAQVASSLARSLARECVLSVLHSRVCPGWLSRRNRSQIVLEYENGRAMVVRTDAAIARVGGISPGTEVHLTRYIELGQGFRYVQST